MPARKRVEVQRCTIQFSAAKKGFQYGEEHLLVAVFQDRHFPKKLGVTSKSLRDYAI